MEIVLYQAEWCPYSHRVRHLLTTHGVNYKIVNVEANPKERLGLLLASGQDKIPVLVIDETPYCGFEDIAYAIKEHCPQVELFIRGHAAKSAAFIARLDADRSPNELAHDLIERAKNIGIEIVLSKDRNEISLELTGEQEFVKTKQIDMRTRPLLPLKISVYQHENGAVASAVRPHLLWMSLHNPELNNHALQLSKKLEVILSS